MRLCETKKKGEGIALFGGAADLPAKSIAAIVSQYLAMWGH